MKATGSAFQRARAAASGIGLARVTDHGREDGAELRDALPVARGERNRDLLLEVGSTAGEPGRAATEHRGLRAHERHVSVGATHAAGRAGPSAAGFVSAARIAAATASRSDRMTPWTAATRLR